jgi:hypothetical protein
LKIYIEKKENGKGKLDFLLFAFSIALTEKKNIKIERKNEYPKTSLK